MKKVLVISDLQTGSMFSNWPEDFPIKDGGTWRLNYKQMLIRNAWNQFCDKMSEIKPDILVINGDVIEGHQEKNLGITTVTTNLREQASAAAVILSPLVQIVKEVYFVKGTSYHDRETSGPVDAIAKELGAVPFRKGQYTDWVLNLEIDKVIINFVHRISIASGLYRATPPDREGIWSALAGISKVPAADCVVRSHVHFYCHVEHSSKHIIITPGWQYQTDYQIIKSYYRMQPEIGGVLLHVYPENKGKEDDPIYVQKIIIKLPREKTIISQA